MGERGHAHGLIPIEQWLREARSIEGESLDDVRLIPRWREDAWQAFPDAGCFQPTRMTAESTSGACSAIWLKLEPGEGFDPHRHPHAIHTMVPYEGEALLLWEEDGEILSTPMRVGETPYAVLSTMPHAIVASRGTRIVMLVFNTPPDDSNHPDYALPVEAPDP